MSQIHSTWKHLASSNRNNDGAETPSQAPTRKLISWRFITTNRQSRAMQRTNYLVGGAKIDKLEKPFRHPLLWARGKGIRFECVCVRVSTPCPSKTSRLACLPFHGDVAPLERFRFASIQRGFNYHPVRLLAVPDDRGCLIVDWIRNLEKSRLLDIKMSKIFQSHASTSRL